VPLINGIARGGEGAGSRQHVEEHKIQKRPPKGEKAFLENEDHHLVLDQRGAKRCEWRGCRNPQ